MFDSLLGGKFSNKCKHSVKCIKSRIVLIRKKKQATVRLLKKDVADLLANGHDANAFGRIEALIIEINHTSCYDIIEQYCECILKQLPFLQKQRECPEEAMEAVSTLIFSAARFSDLPELYDLRRVFEERYGSHMESSANAEFVKNMQKKSFSMDKKLQVMQEISAELSVKWDRKAFQQRMSNPTSASASDKSKRSNENNEQLLHTEMNGKNAAVNGRKEAVLSAGCAVNGKKEAVFSAGGAVNGKKDDGTSAGCDQEGPFKEKWEPPPRSFMQKQKVQPEARDIHVIPSISNGWSHDPAEKTRKKVSAAAREPENVEPCYAIARVPPYDKAKESQNGTHNDHLNDGTACNRSWTAQEEPGLIGLDMKSAGSVINRDVKAVNMIPPYTKSTGGRNGSNATDYEAFYNKLPKADGGFKPIVQERPTKPANSKDTIPINMIPPPYTKPNFRNPSDLSDDAKLTDVPMNSSSTADYERPHGGERPKPVSVRRKHSKLPLAIETDNVNYDAKPRSHSPHGQRKEGRWIKDDFYAEEIMDRHPRKAAEEMDGAVSQDRHVSRTPSGRTKNGGRRSTATYDGDCDEVEEVMDRLLVHYSKKGMINESSKRRARTSAPPAALVVDAGRGGDHHHHHHHVHYSNGRSHPGTTESVRPRPERVTSLPLEPVSPVPESSVGKGPVRATSMQPDKLSPNGGLVHPRLPDYDDLAARFIALKKT